MTFEPVPGQIVSVSPAAKAVLTRAAAKAKGTASRSALTDKLYRAQVREQLVKGANPNSYSWELVEQLEAAYPSVRKAVSRWYAARVPR